MEFEVANNTIILYNLHCNLQFNAEIAQLVEHTTENRGVAGSSPALGTFCSLCKKERELSLS